MKNTEVNNRDFDELDLLIEDITEETGSDDEAVAYDEETVYDDETAYGEAVYDETAAYDEEVVSGEEEIFSDADYRAERKPVLEKRNATVKKAAGKKRPAKGRQDRRKRAKRSKNIRNLAMYVLGLVIRVVLYASVIFFVYSICSDAYAFGTKLFTESGVAEKDSVEDVEVVVTIPAGASRSEVATILKDNGLIEDEFLFYIQSYLYEGEFYSGTYTLRTSYEPEVIVDILSGIQQ